ncbi:MAG: S-layer homology domain-containing protein [Clostridiaceae bacterium]|nr:S-layer homology domain-containing protein [Clostridiaceae bacterium]
MDYTRKKISISVLLLFIYLFNLMTVLAAEEVPANVYMGSKEAEVILKNMDFQDVEAQGQDYWARDAIYDMAALSIIKGYGDKNFNRQGPVTKVQALALIYRAAGREEEAQLAAEAIELQRGQENKRTNAIDVWGDGYLKLAADDGLITPEQLENALAEDQRSLNPQTDFIKNAPAQRQEVAEWIAKILQLTPVYDQQALFNSFRDWRDADPLKIPYIEAVLREKIMNGTPQGFLYPKSSIPREQMAQVLKNAQKFILNRQNWTEKKGYIEKIARNISPQIDGQLETTIFKVRNSDGSLDHILITSYDDIIVLGRGAPGTSALLKDGDSIAYIVDANGVVKLVRVLGDSQDAVRAGAIVSIDPEAFKISIKNNGDSISEYAVARSAEIIIDGKFGTFEQLKVGLTVQLTLKGNIAIKIRTMADEQGLDDKEVTGIVEDINTDLGYISLYDESGKKSFNLLRVYNFLNPSLVKVIRNGREAEIQDVQPGDSAFLKLDEQGYVTEIACSQNYTVKYGKVLTKNPTSVIVQYDDGTQELLDIEQDTLITKDKKEANYTDVLPGSQVKVVLHRTDNFTRLKELVVESTSYNINAIYKANVYFFDEYNSSLILQNLKKLELGRWTLTGQKGFKEIPVKDTALIYAGNRRINAQDINERYVDKEVYVAVESGLGGVERAVQVRIRDESDIERVYTDSIVSLKTGTGEMRLAQQQDVVRYASGSIIVKNGKLVGGNNLSANDQVYVVASRDYTSGRYEADVIQVLDMPSDGAYAIYRGRIQSIQENSDFTLQSFSQLDGVNWEYYNTPKTFLLSNETKIVDQDGVVNNREFNEYSDRNYIGKVVTVVSDGVKAILISEAPYGVYSLRGEVYLGYGQTAGNSLSLKKVTVYNRQTGLWDQANDAEINLRADTIIMKDGRLAKVSDLKRGSVVRIIKADPQPTGEAFIVIIEK